MWQQNKGLCFWQSIGLFFVNLNTVLSCAIGLAKKSLHMKRRYATIEKRTDVLAGAGAVTVTVPGMEEMYGFITGDF